MHVQTPPFAENGLVDHDTEVLLGFLDAEREHVFGILEGFSEEQLRRPVLPSGWSCLSMLHVLKETAGHAGHLDAAAELLDGRQWIVLGDA
jgi:hypothetical protein